MYRWLLSKPRPKLAVALDIFVGAELAATMWVFVSKHPVARRIRTSYAAAAESFGETFVTTYKNWSDGTVGDSNNS